MRISMGAKVLVLLALSIALLIGVESLLVKYLPPFYGILRADIREALYRPYFQIGDLPVTPVFLVKALLFLLLLGLLSRAMRRGGAVGIGVGFGLQNIANNFVSGIILLMERPIRVGDRVEVGGTNGDVVRIGARNDPLIGQVPLFRGLAGRTVASTDVSLRNESVGAFLDLPSHAIRREAEGAVDCWEKGAPSGATVRRTVQGILLTGGLQ